MHYYDHNIGDYRKDTGHLTLLEHGIYRSLLDTYYLDERPLALDHAKLMRSHSVRTADEVQSFENVLQDFFERTEDGYVHKRCEVVIAKYRAKGESARASAKARWDKEKGNADANEMRTHSEGNANQEPRTKNQEPKEKTKTKRAPRFDAQARLSSSGVDQQVIDDWITHRKSKRASITETVINERASEAAKAGISLGDALRTECSRGWMGFEAAWLRSTANGARASPQYPNRQEALEAKNREVAERAAERLTLEFDHARH